MKKRNRTFLSSILLLASAAMTGQSAEISEICGSDTVKISLDNYQYGKVNWQESYDGENWITIADRHDTLLLIHTDEEKYIRGCITTSTCEQVFSNPVHIRQQPMAYAGMDKDVMLDVISLRGNEARGAGGKWEIIQGEGGTLESPDSAATLLSGTDTTYLVTYTLTNHVCSSSMDTVKISFIENEYNPNRIIVDSTDEVVRDSCNFPEGIYYIRFSEVLPVNDSVLLIGYSGEGFLRKTYAFDQVNDTTFRFYTTPGEIEDLLIEGVLNVGDDVDVGPSEAKSAPGYQLLDHVPTRKEIMNDPKFREGTFVYYFPEAPDHGSIIGKNHPSKGGFDLIDMNNVKMKVEFNDTVSMTVGLDGSINFNPNFVFDYRIRCGFLHKWWQYQCELNYLKAGMENAVLENNFTVSMNCDVSLGETLMKSVEKNLYKKKSAKLIIAGTVPILVTNTLSLDFTIEPVLDASINTSYTWERSSSFSAYMLYRRGKYLKPVCEKGPSHSSSSYEVMIKGNAGVNFVLEPKIDMKLYGIVGPYLKVPLSLRPEICYSSRSVDGGDFQDTWGFNVPLSIDAELGCDVKLFRKVLFNSSVGTNIYKTGFFNPYQIEMISGNHQEALPFAEIDQPFKVQVKNNWGGRSADIPVYFNVMEGDGSFSSTKIYTDDDGVAENYLALGGELYNKIKVDAFTCEYEDLEGADDMIFEVNSGCGNSSVQLQFDYLEDETVITKGVMGTPPYQYSLDGASFSAGPIAMNIDAALAQKYFYVKDAAGCMASNTVDPIDACIYSDLSVSVRMLATSATVDGTGGTLPYMYSMDSDTAFTSNNLFDYLEIGDHEVFVRDQAGCTASTAFSVNMKATDSLLVHLPLNGDALDISGNQHHGTADASYTEDRFGAPASAAFVDYRGKVAIPADEQLVFDEDFTINFWSYTKAMGEVASGEHALLSIGEAEIETTGLHFMVDYWENYPVYHLFGYSIEYESMYHDYDAEMEAWTMYTLTRRADTVYLYVNDRHVLSLELPGMVSSESGIILGNNTAGDRALNSYLDEVRIYNRTLGQLEIEQLYHDNGWKDGILNDPFVDPLDGQVYSQVRIGEQVWMRENLRATRYADGTPIAHVADSASWVALEDGAYCWYNNDSAKYANTYGALYNGYVIASGNVCPEGWRVPGNDDWDELINYVGGAEVAGGKLKEAGTAHWEDVSTGKGTDEKAFTALPAGGRFAEGNFTSLHHTCWWWTSSSWESGFYVRHISSFETIIRNHNYAIGNGFSGRCIKEE